MDPGHQSVKVYFSHFIEAFRYQKMNLLALTVKRFDNNELNASLDS